MTQLPTLDLFFNLSEVPYVTLFEGCAWPWEALVHLSAYLSSKRLGDIEVDIPPSAFLVDPTLISIGPGSIVEPGAYIRGPCIIGENCIIRHGAYIRGGVLLGKGCVIGHGTEVKHSILLNRAKAAHFNYIGDSIIGNGVNLGAGVKCANFRLDQEEICIVCNEHKIPTGLKKLGAIIGDGAQIGCNCVINPGTLIGKKALCLPCLNICRSVSEGAKLHGVF